jgi:signal transduction histidine kinase
VNRYLVSAATVAVATRLELFIASSPAARLSLTPFALSIALSAFFGGFGPGALALLLSVLALDFFVLTPGGLFDFSSASDALVLFAFTAGWLGFCALAQRKNRRDDRDRRRLLEAEDAAWQADRVAQLTGALAQARTPAAVIEAAVQEPLHALKAAAGLLVLISHDDRAMEVARLVGYRPEDRDRRTAAALAGKGPTSDAIGRGAAVILESPEAYTAEYPGVPPGEFRALAAVPLLIGSRVASVVQLEFRESRRFTSADREYLFALGARAAQALDRTWQYESALRARADAASVRERADLELAERQKVELALRTSEARYRALAARTSRLHGLAAALSEAVTLQAVAQAVVQHGRIVVGATNGDVTLLVDNGTRFETLFTDAPGSADAQRRFDAEPGLCATQAVTTRTPVFIGSFAEWQERYWRSASIAADGGYVSSATVPLLVEGTPIGVLAFHFTAPVNFDDEYQALLISVAQHCAQALDRARLYEAEQHARSEAETANRLKDEFVSVVSHELRTPLNAMLGWTSMLQTGSLDAATSARALQSIQDNATRQVRLVEELLDFSRLKSGRMTLDVEEIDLRSMLRDVVESVVTVAAANGLDLDVSPVPDVRLRGDSRRLEQVFLNLLGNALKFTPDGGRIAIVARALDGLVEIRVSDTGAGIDPEFLPHVFERFRQADHDTARRYGGVGLGLSIARELVEAHKGHITAESAGTGRGSTFVVTLPAEPAPMSEPGAEPAPPVVEPPQSTIH